MFFKNEILIWPIGLGDFSVAKLFPQFLVTLKFVMIPYIDWLTWKIYATSLKLRYREEYTSSFAAGLLVHPLNTKVW